MSYIASGSITIAAVSAAAATSGATKGASRVQRSANAAITDRTSSEARRQLVRRHLDDEVDRDRERDEVVREAALGPRSEARARSS